MVQRIEPPASDEDPPFASVVVAAGFVFVSGQVGIDPSTKAAREGIEAQTKQCLANLQSALEKAGARKDRVVKTTVFLRDVADFAAMNRVYRSFFAPDYPARSTVQARLVRDALLVEIEAIAALDDSG